MKDELVCVVACRGRYVGGANLSGTRAAVRSIHEYRNECCEGQLSTCGDR